MTWETVLRLTELAITSGAGVAIFKGGFAIRDAVRDLKAFTARLREDVDDHEDRLRAIEGRPERRTHDRRHAS